MFQFAAAYFALQQNKWELIFFVLELGVLNVFFLISNFDSVVFKTSMSLILLTVVFLYIYLLIIILGLQRYCELQFIKEIIEKHIFFGSTLYLLLIILHIVIIPISTVPIVLFGVAIFGVNIAFVLTTIATVLGSILAFILGKTCGKKFVVWLIGEQKFEKYNKSIRQRGKYYLTVMFLLPIFPDDILCLLAGCSNLKYKEFIIIMLIARPPMIAFTCYVGTGRLIPFSGWGIAVWIAIAVSFVVIFFSMHKLTKKKILNKN
jgi:uncharacterized membrane protein YdjX (TVP38/TMEM64 family)